MVTDPPVKGVYVTLHLLCEELVAAKVQVPLLKVPPETLALQDTVPVGALFVPPLVSLTAETKVIGLP